MRTVLAPAVLSTDDGGRNTKAQTHEAFSGLVDSGRGGFAISGRMSLTALPVASTTGRAYPRTEAKGQDLSSMFILALRSEESKGQNDVPQLPDSMQEIRERSQGLPALLLRPVLKDFHRTA